MGKRKVSVKRLSFEELKKTVEACLDRNVRQRDATDNFCKAARWRYLDPSSHLRTSDLSAAAFTALVYHVPLTLLQQLSDSGIHDLIKRRLENLELYAYWHECLSELKKDNIDLSKLYFFDVGNFLYPTNNITPVNIESNDPNPVSETVNIKSKDAYPFSAAKDSSNDRSTSHVHEHEAINKVVEIQSEDAHRLPKAIGCSVTESPPVVEAVDVLPEYIHRYSKAILGSLVNARHVLPAFLYDGLKQSERRKRQDTIQKKDSITNCLEMYMSLKPEGDDFRLQIWNCEMHGHLLWIAQNADIVFLQYLYSGQNGRRELLRYLLGDIIFEAMETSEVTLAKQRELREQSAARKDDDYKEALRITRDGEDYRLMISLGLQKGLGIYKSLFGN